MPQPSLVRFDCGASTQVGGRATNEDAYCCASDLGLFAVADGLGGYEGGEIASVLAVQTLSDFIRRQHQSPLGSGPGSGQFWADTLARAFALADEEIRKKQLGPLQMMGTTLSALLIADAEAVVCHLGDSRIYRLRGGVMQQLTRDHSLLAEILERGVDVPVENRQRYRNELTRALGLEGASTPDKARFEVERPDVFLLCTDGLYEALSLESISRGLEQGPAQEASDGLVQTALNRGAHDNVTAVVVRVCQ